MEEAHRGRGLCSITSISLLPHQIRSSSIQKILWKPELKVIVMLFQFAPGGKIRRRLAPGKRIALDRWLSLSWSWLHHVRDCKSMSEWVNMLLVCCQDGRWWWFIQVGFVENYYVKQDFGSGGGGGNRCPLNERISSKILILISPEHHFCILLNVSALTGYQGLKDHLPSGPWKYFRNCKKSNLNDVRVWNKNQRRPV